MIEVMLGVVSIMLIVESVVAMKFILKSIRQRDAMNDARYQLSGVDGLLLHDNERIAKARRILLEGLAS